MISSAPCTSITNFLTAILSQRYFRFARRFGFFFTAERSLRRFFKIASADFEWSLAIDSTDWAGVSVEEDEEEDDAAVGVEWSISIAADDDVEFRCGCALGVLWSISMMRTASMRLLFGCCYSVERWSWGWWVERIRRKRSETIRLIHHRERERDIKVWAIRAMASLSCHVPLIVWYHTSIVRLSCLSTEIASIRSDWRIEDLFIQFNPNRAPQTETWNRSRRREEKEGKE